MLKTLCETFRSSTAFGTATDLGVGIIMDPTSDWETLERLKFIFYSYTKISSNR